MSNFTAKILNNAVRSLSANQAVIAATSNNIANVNTPNYTRRTINLETASNRDSGAGVNVGSGVSVAGVKRMADEFLASLMRSADSGQNASQMRSDMLGRLEQLFNITGDSPSIGSRLNEFFAAANDLTTNPSSIELRSNFIQRTQDLITIVRTSYNAIADLQTEADNRIKTEVQSVNTLLNRVAELNTRISAVETSGNVAADDRDQRDYILQELSKKMSFSTLEVPDGSVTLSLSNGFVLVSGGNARQLETTTTPSFASGPLPPSLAGGVLSYVVFDYDPSTSGQAHVDLTQLLKSGDGSIGGLLQVRGYNAASNTSAFQADGGLVEVASRIEAITRDLLTRVNTTYLGPDEDSGTAGFQPSAFNLLPGPPPNNQPAVYGLFDFSHSGAKDVDSNGLPDDLATVGIDNFSSRLQIAFTNPLAVAAARDLNSTGGAYSVVAGDGRNMEALVQLQTQSASFSAGNYALTGRYDDVYNEMIAHVGGLKLTAQTQADLDRDKFITVSARRDEVSAVSLDEEFSSLIKFQKAYQASAKLIRVADDLLTQVLQVL